MGRSYTPKYAVNVKSVGAHLDMFSWNSRDSGRPNDSNLASWVRLMNASFAPGGINYHPEGDVVHITAAEIVENRRGGAVVATYKAPLFEVT